MAERSFDYLCRVCAANTNHPNAQGISILKTNALREKIEKHLFLTVTQDDPLPKVLCQNCFRQVEKTASLAQIARHTQVVFSGFLKTAEIAEEQRNHNREVADVPEYTSIQSGNKHDNRQGRDSSIQQREKEFDRHYRDSSFHQRKEMVNKHNHEVSTMQRKESADRHSHDASMYQRKETVDKHSHDLSNYQRKELTNKYSHGAFIQQRKDLAGTHSYDASSQQRRELIDRHGYDASVHQREEVVVNVSVNDPLTRETQHKMISASQKSRKSSEGHFVHPSTSTSPRPMTGPSKSTDVIEPFTKAPESSVINFFRGRVPTSTTFTAGDMVMAKVFTGDLQSTSELNFNARCKRKLNEFKSVSSKASRSLLKVSHKSTGSLPTVRAEQKLEQQVDSHLTDELPPQIIIAEPKTRKLDGHRTQKPSKSASQTALPRARSELSPPIRSRSVQRSVPTLGARAKPDYTDDILLGKVIKDTDLLKLIMKALKWPVNSLNLEEQMQRLKNSKFATIMSDPNLLHDNDLTQLLGPYLAPMLVAAQMIQQQQMMAAAAAQSAATAAPPPQPPPSTAVYNSAQGTVDLASAIPYKLPAETSVQLVPASPEDDERIRADDSMTKPKYQSRVSDPNKVRRTIKRSRDLSLVADHSVERVKPRRRSRSSASQTSMNYNLDISPSFLVRMASKEARDYTNEALSKLLDKQRTVIRKTASQTETIIVVDNDNDNENDNEMDFDTDDIILIEPPTQQTQMPYVCSSSSIDDMNTSKENFSTTQTATLPEVTRPIVKRRKTVIQSHPSKIDISNEMPHERTTHTVTFNDVVMQRSLSDSTSADSVASNASTIMPYSADNSTQEDVSKETKTPTQMCVRSTTTSTTDIKPPKLPKKMAVSTRSTLGKELLAAIGLQKVSDYDKEDGGGAEEPAAVECRVSEDDVNKIRSALKTSLKKAQDNKRKQLQLQIKKQLNQTLTDHQSRKNSGPIIQDADSTTKHVVKEPTSGTSHTVGSAPNQNADSSSEDIGSDNETVAMAREKIKQHNNNLKAKQVTIETKNETKAATSARKIVEPKKVVRKTNLLYKPPVSRIPTPSKSQSLLKNRPTVSTAAVKVATKETKTENSSSQSDSNELWSETTVKDSTNPLSLLKSRSAISLASKEQNDSPLTINDSKQSDSNEVWSETTVDGSGTVPSSLEALLPKRRGRKPALEKKSPIRRTIVVPNRTTSLVSNRVLKAAKTAAARSRSVAKPNIQMVVEVLNENELVNSQSRASVSPKPNTNTNKYRPSRVSKTMSKYYKGPDKPISARRGAVQTRATRARF